MDLNFNVDEGFLEVKAKVREFFPKSSYSVRIQENTDQKKYGHFLHIRASICAPIAIQNNYIRFNTWGKNDMDDAERA